MPILKYRGASPRISEDCFVAETATIVGNVVLGEGSSVWFGASIRAEEESVNIGNRSNVQDNCVIHTDAGFPCAIGDGVTLGHGAIVHGATIGSNCLVGMGAILLNGAKIGKNCLVGAGALVRQGAEIPENNLVIGSPAIAKRELAQEEIDQIRENARHYYEFRSEYLSMNYTKKDDEIR